MSIEEAPPRAIGSTALQNLRLIETQAKHPGKTFAVLLSGDGGWSALDKSLVATLATNGIPSVGWNSLCYYWAKRTPDESARDLQVILEHYFAVWSMDKVILIGYSRGADVLPFMANRLPADLTARASLIALLGVARGVDFEFHLTDWIPGRPKNPPYKVQPEVEKLAGRKSALPIWRRRDGAVVP